VSPLRCGRVVAATAPRLCDGAKDLPSGEKTEPFFIRGVNRVARNREKWKVGNYAPYVAEWDKMCPSLRMFITALFGTGATDPLGLIELPVERLAIEPEYFSRFRFVASDIQEDLTHILLLHLVHGKFFPEASVQEIFLHLLEHRRR